MDRTNYIKRMTATALGVAIIAGVFIGSAVAAETITSSNYKINGNFGGTFGGQTSSTNYKLSAIGGEAIVGAGQSGSYIIDQQQTTPAQTMQLSVQPNGLVAYYPLNEASGATAYDASANTNDGSLVSGPTWTTGKLSGGLAFNGSTGQSVSIPDNSALTMGSQMTLSLWAYQSSATVSRALASHWNYTGGGISGGWALQTENATASRLQFFVANSSTDVGSNYITTDAGTWASGGWHHIIVVYDGTQVTALDRVAVYIDDVKVGTTMAGAIPASMQNAASPFMIGDFNGLNRTWNGSLDHVKIYNRALNVGEVSAEYNAQNNGIPTGLTLGTLSGNSTTSLVDAVVRTGSAAYGLSVQQDHALQSGANTIPGVSGTIASPGLWTENSTEGLGFTVIGAPTLDSKWGGGSNYATFPVSPVTFYSEAAHTNGVADVVNVRLRLDVNGSQPIGAYSNNIVYTGTTLP